MAHVMTGQDRRVLSKLLAKINSIHSIKEHQKYTYFLRKAIEEARKRNAPMYADRFCEMLLESKLSYAAFQKKPILKAAASNWVKLVITRIDNEAA